MLKLILFFFGVVALVGMIWHIGPARIWETMSGLGPKALLLILLPSLPMYLLETYGWQLTLGPRARQVSFGRLVAIRAVGECVNMTTPTAYLGGEPLKAYFLRGRGIPLVDGLASVVVAKTLMTFAEVLFIVVGIGCAVWFFGESGIPAHFGLMAISSVGLLALGTAAFFLVQRRGMFIGVLKFLRACRIRIRFLEAREEQLQELDRTILKFYAGSRRAFFLATLIFFLGWIAEVCEVAAILYVLTGSTDFLMAFAIGALSVFVKGGTFLIPGSVGVQEGGNLALVVVFGFSTVIGIAFALLRRFREILWIAIGLLCFVAMGGSPPSPSGIQQKAAPTSSE